MHSPVFIGADSVMPPPEIYCPPQSGLETWAAERRAEFEEVVVRNMPRLSQMARRCLRNREDAEDAVQDAVMLAFRHVHQFEGRAQMSSWLTAILLNSVRTQIRRRPRYILLSLDQSSDTDDSTYAQLLADPRPTQDQTVEKNELCHLVRRIVGSLPHAERRALQLLHQDEMSVKDAAGKLGVSEAAMKSQISRGRASLTRKLRRTLGIPAPAMAADYCDRKKVAARDNPPAHKVNFPPGNVPIAALAELKKSGVQSTTFDVDHAGRDRAGARAPGDMGIQLGDQRA